MRTSYLGRRAQRPATRTASILAATALLLGGLSVTGPTAVAADPPADRAAASVDVINRQARNYDEPMRLSVTTMYDYLVAFALAGHAGAAAKPGRAWYVLDQLRLRSGFAEGSTTQSPVKMSGVAQAAPTSLDDLTRILHVAAIYGQPPTTFAGRDFVALVRDFVLPDTDADAGWLKTTVAGTTKATPLQQAKAVLALDAAGAAIAAKTATALRTKQLPNGSFATSFTGTTGSLEPTAYAVEALVAEGSAASLTAAASAATWLIGLQVADGSFTGGTTPTLVGLAADALQAAGRGEEAAKATAWVEALQVLDGVDPIYAGAIASTPAQRAQITGGAFGPLSYSTLVTNAIRGSWALATSTLADVHVTDLGSTRPPIEGNDSFHDGHCVGDEGVTVVVDADARATEGPGPVVRCALGTQVSGWAALENADVRVGSVVGYPGAALCQLDGIPVEGYPYCWTGQGYWSYWHGEPGGLFEYSQLGASNRYPPKGTVEGWSFVPLGGGGGNVPPRSGPSFVPGQDTTAPVVTFTAGPQGTVDGGKKLVFDFTLDDMGASLECRLDGEAWGACDPPSGFDRTTNRHTLRDVADGPHTFSVRSVDVWGNETTRSRSFTVVPDVNAPVIAITKAPGNPTNVTIASFAMTVDDADAEVRCRLDEGEWDACTSRTTHNLTGLAYGQHTFGYRATDLSGNVATTSYAWTIAADAPPVVLVTSGPSGYSGLPYNSGKTSVSVNYGVAEAGTVTTRECRLDDGEWAACYSASQARFTGLSLAEGPHRVSIRVTSADGRTSQVATYDWSVDSTAPVIAVTRQPAATTAERNATVAFTVTDASPVYLLTCAVDGGTASACTSPLTLPNLPAGEHKVEIQARDVAYNYAGTQPVRVSWTVLKEPAILGEAATSGVETDAAVIGAHVTAGNYDQQVRLEWSPNEDHSSPTALDPVAVAAGESRDVSFALTGLHSITPYWYRVVTRDTDGVEVAGSWASFTTRAIGTALSTPTASAVGSTGATIATTVDPGDLDASVRVEYRPAGSSGDGALTQAQEVAGGGAVRPLTFGITGLSAGSEFQVRAVARATDGSVVTSEWATFTTAPIQSATVGIDATHSGNRITLTWTATDATTLTAGGDWSGARAPAGGSEVVEVPGAGSYTFTLTAEGEGGATTQAGITVVIPLPAARLGVTTPREPVLKGRSVDVRASGLAPSEPYRIAVSGVVVGRGTADASGRVARTVTMPRTLAAGRRHLVSVVGAGEDRAGSGSIQVVRSSARLRVGVTAAKRRAWRARTVVVRGLAPFEQARVYDRGRLVRTAVAGSRGVLRVRYRLTGAKGLAHKVVVVGIAPDRRGKATFRAR